MNKNQRTKAFENVREQIGFCGIWCGSCAYGNGTIMELARRNEDLISIYGLPEWGPKDIDYDVFLKGLESIQEYPPCLGCLKGGGRDKCEMRVCAIEKGLNACSECRDEKKCRHEKILDHMRSGAVNAGLFVNTGNVDKQELVENWTAKLKHKWPCLVLFVHDE